MRDRDEHHAVVAGHALRRDEAVSAPTLSLQLQLQNTVNDVPTDGAWAPYLDSYLRSYTGRMEDRLKGTFSLTVSQGRG